MPTYVQWAPQFGCKYSLIASDGSTAVFNDDTNANYVGALNEVSGLDSPEVRESAQDLVEADGGQHGNFWRGRRPIVLSGIVFNHATLTQRDQRLDKLRNVVGKMYRTDGELQWSNNPVGTYPTMRCWVRLQQPLRISGGWNKEFQVPLVSQYPQIFGTSGNNSAVTASGPTGVLVANQGDYPYYPLVYVYGPSTNPLVGNFTHSEIFYTTGLTVASGETLRINMFTHSADFIAGARTGQSANRYIDFANTVSWPAVYPDNNGFYLTGGGTFQVYWVDSWS